MLKTGDTATFTKYGRTMTGTVICVPDAISDFYVIEVDGQRHLISHLALQTAAGQPATFPRR